MTVMWKLSLYHCFQKHLEVFVWILFVWTLNMPIYHRNCRPQLRPLFFPRASIWKCDDGHFCSKRRCWKLDLDVSQASIFVDFDMFQQMANKAGGWACLPGTRGPKIILGGSRHAQNHFLIISFWIREPLRTQTTQYENANKMASVCQHIPAGTIPRRAGFGSEWVPHQIQYLRM